MVDSPAMIVSALGWPPCVCVAALIALLIFRKPITGLIERITEVTPKGVTTAPAKAAQEVQPPAASAADELLKGFDNQLLLEQENLILEALQEKHVQAPAEREKVLVRHLAGAYTTLRLESVYRSIFGSQLRVLEALNQSEPTGLPQEALEGEYDAGKNAHPQFYSTYSFQEWLGYLVKWSLVIKGTNGAMHITLLGKEFLKYRIQLGYTANKFG